MQLIKRFTIALSNMETGAATARMKDSEAAALRSARAGYQFSETGGKHGFGAQDLSWSLLYQDSPGVYSENLPRAVWAYRARTVEELRDFTPVLSGRVQAMGLAGIDAATRSRLEELVVEWGVSRMVPVGQMAWPPADWRHNGQMQLLPLLNWTEFE